MRLPDNTFQQRDWRIHRIAPDFELEEVWALRTPGGADDFRRLLEVVTTGDNKSSRTYNVLFAVRWRLGRLLGWDDPSLGIGRGVSSLRDRLPADLLDAPRGPSFTSVPFVPVYLTDGEWVAEIGNRTVHALLHLGWVDDGDGGFRGEMAVLVKPKGLLGRSYMAAIKPLRVRIVVPALLKMIESDWREKLADRTRGSTG